MAFDLSDYIPVNVRIHAFKKTYPDGRLTSEIIDTGHPGFIAVKAYAYRSPDDPLPGVGLAWEAVPGPTQFTKNSELQNAETAAWGRALIAALIADASKGIASRDEVAARQSEGEPEFKSDKQWLWEESAVFKAWSRDERAAAIQAAMRLLKIDEVGTRDQAVAVLNHVAEVYEKRPTEGQGSLV